MFNRPKGTRDFLPAELNFRHVIFNRFREVSQRYGFGEVETPVFEDYDLLTAKSGDEIKDQTFALEKRGSEQFGLRFDMTVPVARLFAQKNKELSKPVKWFYVSKNWRYEQPQKGRLREFYQLGVELLGSKDSLADVEIISLAVDFMYAIGFQQEDFVVKVNNRKVMEGYLESLFIDKDKFLEVIQLLDKKKKISQEKFEQELAKVLDRVTDSLIESLWNCDKITVEDLEKIDNDKLKEGVKEITMLVDYLAASKKLIKFDLSVARGLAYYTGIVFECFDADESLRSIFAGGRYDKMIGAFSGIDIPATGFAIGDVTLFLLMEKKGFWKTMPNIINYYLVAATEDKKVILKVAKSLRDKNFSVSFDLMNKSFKAQMDQANKLRAENIIVVGDKEIESGLVIIKNQKSGKEKQVKILDL